MARVGFSISAAVTPPRPWWQVELLSLSSIFLGLEKELYSFSIYKNLRGNLPRSWSQAFTVCSWFRKRAMFFLYTSHYQEMPWISLALNRSSPWKKGKEVTAEKYQLPDLGWRQQGWQKVNHATSYILKLFTKRRINWVREYWRMILKNYKTNDITNYANDMDLQGTSVYLTLSVYSSTGIFIGERTFTNQPTFCFHWLLFLNLKESHETPISIWKPLLENCVSSESMKNWEGASLLLVGKNECECGR